MLNVKFDKGHGFVTEEGKVCMERCFKCGQENYAMAVMSGLCAWCGFDANAGKTETTTVAHLPKKKGKL